MATNEFELGAEGSGWGARAPVRDSCRLVPLIDGIPAFERMERAILAARKSVHLGAWAFQPDVPLSDRAAKRVGATWSDLLLHVAGKGATVRLLVSSLDPLVKESDHRASWRRAAALWQRARKTLKEHHDRLQVICSMHDATVTRGIADYAEKRARAIAAELNKYRKANGMPAALRRYGEMPGIWRNIRLRRDTNRFEIIPGVDYVLHPASHHQKICIVDGRTAFCGGLDVAIGRLDAPAHTRMLWHDVACQIEGDAVADIEANFVERWNRERDQFVQFVAEANALNRGVSLAPIAPTPARAHAATGTAPGSSQVQVLRTMTSDSAWSRMPSVARKDIEEAHILAFRRAREFVYLENQYLREPALVDWLRESDAVDRLQVIVVLPLAPEEAAQGTIDEATQHGLFLQHGVLTGLRELFGERLGLYSMVRRKRSGARRSPTAAFGSQQVYVHSKCLIVDDRFALIGSANATGRSFRVDSELSVGWCDEAGVAEFRRQLWNELLGRPKGMADWPRSNFVEQWEAIAKANEAAAPAERSGFIVRHDPERPAILGRRHALLPDEFADLTGGPVDDDVAAPA